MTNKVRERISAPAKMISNVRIGQRFLISMMTIVTVLVIPVMIMLIMFQSYQSKYNRTLENLGDISYIIQETETQGNRIIDYFTMDKSIEESGEAEIIVNMLHRLGRIKDNIGNDEIYKDNLDTLQIVNNLLESYAADFKSGAGKCGEKYSMAGDMDFYSMADTANYIVKNCNKLQALEMNRSEHLREEIGGSFATLFTSIVIVVLAVIVFAVFAIYFITESIIHPLGLLRSHISDVSRSGLFEDGKQAVKDKNDGDRGVKQ